MCEQLVCNRNQLSMCIIRHPAEICSVRFILPEITIKHCIYPKTWFIKKTPKTPFYHWTCNYVHFFHGNIKVDTCSMCVYSGLTESQSNFRTYIFATTSTDDVVFATTTTTTTTTTTSTTTINNGRITYIFQGATK